MGGKVLQVLSGHASNPENGMRLIALLTLRFMAGAATLSTHARAGLSGFCVMWANTIQRKEIRKRAAMGSVSLFMAVSWVSCYKPNFSLR